MDRAKFFASARSALFGGKLTQGQVDGITAILDGWQASQMTDVRWLAYMLATAYHETARTMQPIAEYSFTTALVTCIANAGELGKPHPPSEIETEKRGGEGPHVSH